MVIKDTNRPENEGKVFLYQYGKKIFDKLNDLMNPQFDDETAINPFDLWNGANFKLRIRQDGKYRSYDKSEFDSPSAIPGSDEKLEAIWNQEYALKEFVDPANFKSYDELKKQLHLALGLQSASAPVNRAERTVLPEASAPNFKERAASPAAESETIPWNTDEDEDASYFEKLKRLASED